MYTVIEKLFIDEFSAQNISVSEYGANPNVYVGMKGAKTADRLFYCVKGNLFLKNKDGSEIKASKGDIIYFPRDAEYVSYWESEEGGSISLKFLIYNKQGNHILLFNNVEYVTKDKTGELYALFKKSLNEYLKNQSFAVLKLKSYFYEILYAISTKVERSELKNNEKTADIYRAVIYLNNNYMDDVTTEELAEICGLSLSVFRKKFKIHSGISPMRYKQKLRLNHAKQLLQTGDYTVSEVSNLLNCADVSHFNKLYNAEFSKNPSEDFPEK